MKNIKPTQQNRFSIKNIIGLLTLSTTVLCTNVAIAQDNPIAQGAFGYYTDANRFAQTIPTMGANARIQGIGGAATAIGGDISSASVNPAGLGYLQRSEITFSPSFSLLGSDATYNQGGQSTLTEDAKLNFNFAQLGGAFVLPSNNSSGYKGGAFSISYSRLNSFHRRTSYEGTNSQNSIIDYFLNQADGISWNSILPSNGSTDLLALAYDAYLINPDYDFDNGTQDTYYSIVPIAPTLQRETIEYSGSQSQWNFSYGGNYNDKLFFGAGLGIQSFRYEEVKHYEEIVTGQPIDPNQEKALDNLVVNENLSISGTGVNLTAGVIYRPIYPIRLGASITTPTYFSVNDRYNASLSALYNNFYFGNDEFGDPIVLNDTGEISTLDVESTYNLTTPLRASLGAAFFVGKYGFISADVDFINYESSKLLSPPTEFSFTADNQTIQNLYASTMNYRLGAELRLNTFYLRGGIGLYGNTVKEEFRREDEQAFQTRISGGLGVHKKAFYVDLAVVQQNNNNTYTPYNLPDGSNPSIGIQNSTTNIVATVGFHF